MIELSRLTKDVGLELVIRENMQHKIQLCSLLVPCRHYDVVEYRVAGEQLAPVLGAYLEACKNTGGKTRERYERFRRLTRTLRYALAANPALSWCQVPRISKQDGINDHFTDLVINVLPQHADANLEKEIENSVLLWLREDIAYLHLQALKQALHSWSKHGLLQCRTLRFDEAKINSVMPYAPQGGYYIACALAAGEILAANKDIRALLNCAKSGEEGIAPALYTSVKGGVELVGFPEQKTIDRWTSSVLHIRTTSDISMPAPTLQFSLHTRVYGTFNTNAHGANARQLITFQQNKKQLVMRQFPFVYNNEGAKFCEDSEQDFAGLAIARFFELFAPGFQGVIPTRVRKEGGILALPLLATTLQDPQVSIHLGATSTERHDIFTVVSKALASAGFQPLPRLNGLNSLLARKLPSTSVFAAKEKNSSTQQKSVRREIIKQALAANGGNLFIRVLVNDPGDKNYPTQALEFQKVLVDWSGLEIVERFKTDGTACKGREKGVGKADRYGAGSKLILKKAGLTLTVNWLRAESSECNEVGAQRWWLDLQLDGKEFMSDIALEMIEIDDVAELFSRLDHSFSLNSPEPYVLTQRRQLIRHQLGENIQIPVFGGPHFQREIIESCLLEILGSPCQRSIRAENNAIKLSYQPKSSCPLFIELIFWPDASKLASWGAISGKMILDLKQHKSYANAVKQAGRQCQIDWLSQIEKFKEYAPAKEQTVLPIIWLLGETEKAKGADPKPWLRDLFNRMGWIAKFLLFYPKNQSFSQKDLLRINATLLGQLTNHGVPPFQLPSLTLSHPLAASKELDLCAMTITKHHREAIPFVWRTDASGLTEIGLRDLKTGIAWYLPKDAFALIANRKANDYISLGTSQVEQQRNGHQFLLDLLKDLDKSASLLLVNGVSCRSCITHFANAHFEFDRMSLTQTAIIRYNHDPEQPQYFAAEGEATRVDAANSGFKGIFNHSAVPRRSLFLASRGRMSEGFARSKAENRFLDLSNIPLPMPELQPRSVGQALDDKKSANDCFESSKMNMLSEVVLTDLPVYLQTDVRAQQYLLSLIDRLRKMHLEKSEYYRTPFPLHECESLAKDMIKAK